MRRRYRVLLVTTLVASGVAAVSLLTAISTGAAGPVSSALDRLGTAAGSFEHRLRTRISGEGRATSLGWLRPYRESADRLRRPDAMLLGAYDGGMPQTLDGVVKLEQAIGTTLPLVQLYSAWGDKPDQRFPLKLATAVWDIGSIPVLTWEPWLTDFENTRHPHLALRDVREKGGMAAVVRGDYDFYVDQWAADAARFGRPIFVRFAHEMNDPYRYPWGPQNNAAADYVAAWKRVVDRSRAAGAGNVIWVWSPHVAYKGWEQYYPGDTHVDWVATGALNFGTVAHWSQWWSFAEIFGKEYPRLARYGKPMMVAEFGSLAVGGDRAAWYRQALTDLPRRYPAVRALLFFHTSGDQTVTYQKIDWTIAGDSAVAAAVREAIAPWSGGQVPGPARRR